MSSASLDEAEVQAVNQTAAAASDGALAVWRSPTYNQSPHIIKVAGGKVIVSYPKEPCAHISPAILGAVFIGINLKQQTPFLWSPLGC